MRRIRRLTNGLGLIAVIIGIAPYAVVQAQDRSAIWNVVHDLCLENERRFNKPEPCTEIHLNSSGKPDFAVLKDIKGKAHYLIIPTESLSGIESRDLLHPEAANWFEFAWEARALLDRAAQHRVPRDDIALAINSVVGRGQDQLHIHLACISANVKAEIAAQAGSIGPVWSGQTIRLGGRRYFAERVERSELSGFNPIQVVADQIPGAKDDMGRMTIMVVGAVGDKNRNDFLLFAGRSDRNEGDRGKAEDLLDGNCETGDGVR